MVKEENTSVRIKNNSQEVFLAIKLKMASLLNISMPSPWNNLSVYTREVHSIFALILFKKTTFHYIDIHAVISEKKKSDYLYRFYYLKQS